MWAHEREWQTCEHELWTCELDFVHKRKYSCHMDIILLMIHEIPIATLEKYCYHMENIPMILQW